MIKYLFIFLLSFSGSNLLASGGGGGGSDYGSSDLSGAIDSAQKSASGSEVASLVKSLSGDQKKNLMEVLKNPKNLKKLQSLLSK